MAGAAFLFITLGGIGDNLVYYWGPKELRAAGDKAVGATIRLGGQVAAGSVKRSDGVSNLEFDVTDGTATVHVVSRGVPPQLFRDRIGVVVEGTMTKGGPLREPAPHGVPRQQVPCARGQGRRHQDSDALDRGPRRSAGRIRGRVSRGPAERWSPMVPALGRALILLALLAASAGALVGFAAGARPSAFGRAWTRRLAYAFAGLMALANLVMVYALLTHDFSVSYVAQVGSRSVPDLGFGGEPLVVPGGVDPLLGSGHGRLRRGGHLANRDHHPEYMPYAIGVWLAVAPSSASFSRAPPSPSPPVPGPRGRPRAQPAPPEPLPDGHPPAFPLRGLRGHDHPLRPRLRRAARGPPGPRLHPPPPQLPPPALDLPHLAIVLGGWWAYEVLGWGGYWAWDPVENASFLPWLTATAALHSAMLVERKGILKGWTVTLVIATYLLTILGTFMTRSGVFNSVHSFTQSAIGPTILVFLAAALLFSVVLLALRVDPWPRRDSSKPGSPATPCSWCRTCSSCSSPSPCSWARCSPWWWKPCAACR